MGLQVNNEVNVQNSIINNLYSKVQGYTSQFLNTDTNEFASYLNKNYDSVDKNSDKALSKEEVSSSVRQDVRNQELQKLIDNNNFEKMFANIDTNEDGSLSKSEVNPNGNVPDMLKSAYKEIQSNSQNWGSTAVNLAQNLCKNYYASPAMRSLATSAVSALV